MTGSHGSSVSPNAFSERKPKHDKCPSHPSQENQMPKKNQVAEKQLPFHQNLGEMTNAKSKNWLSISLLNIDSTILENVYMYHSFHNLKTSNQASSWIHQNQINGLINALIFTKIFKTLDNNSKDGMVAFYIDFSKFFDKEPHFEMLR